MDRCGNYTGMLHSTQETTLIWGTVQSRPSSAISSAPEWAGRWCVTGRSFLLTMKGSVKYRHPQQLPQCPMRSLIEASCLPLVTQPAAETLLPVDVSPFRLIL